MSDTLDILTLAEGKTACNITGTGHDTELAQFITAVSRRIDELCGPVVNRTVTDELHNGGRGFIRPRKTPVDSVTTLVEYRHTTDTSLTEETNATKQADGFMVDEEWAHNVRIIRRTSGSDAAFPAGRRNVVLTYVAGRAANTAAVDAKFKRAAGDMLQRMWRRGAAAWSGGGDPFEANAVQHNRLFL
ncbi:MAG TPA: hypothetical protein VNU01_00895, partial [Egibacteraceae bacterium]|nr:hypothetical protein [Egibacteraceae bacterium]